MTSSASATVVVELTPPGRGAVAVVVVAGPDALRAVDNCFAARSGHAIGDIPIGRIVLGRWGGVAAATDDLILCRRDERQIEVHCHGGTAAVESVTSRLLYEGCQRLTWQEWIHRCGPDRIRAAAQIALAEAVTERTAAILLDQLNGALTEAVRGIVADIAAAEWLSAADTIDGLLSRKELGLHLTNPWRAVVFGPPNVGKSSLINALAGYERAIVSATPGTTRDVVTVTTAIEGWPIILSDTAGFRDSQDELESAGIKLATNTLSQAELAMFVHDAAMLRDGSSDDDTKIERPSLGSHARVLHVVNKIDLIVTSERGRLLQRFIHSQQDIDEPHAVSALNGEGIADLISAIARALVPVWCPAGLAVPFAAEHIDVLIAARSAVDERDAKTASDLLHALLTNAG